MKSATHVRVPLRERIGVETRDLLFVGAGMGVGALAYLWAGYLGNPDDPSRLIRDPWSLFGYYCLLILALEALVMTSTPHPSRAKIISMLAVTCAWIALVAGAYLVGPGHILAWLEQHLPGSIAHNKQILFIAADLLCIVLLWLGIRFASYDPRVRAEGQGSSVPGERLAGDLLLSTIFSVLLAWAFFAPFWQAGTAIAAPGHPQGGAATQPLTVCDLTWLPFKPDARCAVGPADPRTIFMLDLLILPLIYLLVALVILLTGAFREALNEFRRGQIQEPWAFVKAFRRVVLDIVDRRIKQLPYLLLALRYFWPLLLLAAVVLAGAASKAILLYLYSVASDSNAHILWPFALPVQAWYRNLQPLQLLQLEFGVAVAVFAAVAATVVAATVWAISKPHVGSDLGQEIHTSIEASWSHVKFIGLVLAVSYWALSVVFSIINELALIGVTVYESVTGVPHTSLHGWYWTPFIQPDPLTLLSLVVFLVVILRLPVDRTETQPPRGSVTSRDAAPVAAPPPRVAQE